MTIQEFGLHTGAVSRQAQRRDPEMVAKRALHSIDTLYARRVSEFDAGELFAYGETVLIDRAAAARADAAAATLALRGLGCETEGQLAFSSLYRRAAERYGLESLDIDVARDAPCMIRGVAAKSLLDWAACLAFGPSTSKEDTFLRERFAALVLVDVIAFEQAVSLELGAERPSVPFAALTVENAAAPSLLRDVMIAVESGASLTPARAAIAGSIHEARGVLGPHELQRQTVRDLRISSWATSGGKRVFDIVVSICMLIGLSPILLGVLVLMQFEKGPTFFSHRRIGLNGRYFPCLKFRTMIPDAEAVLKEVLASDPALAAEWAQTQKLKKDPRITRLGWFLRKTSIDELPQLINVIRGEMTLVGARPIILEEAGHWGPHFAAYKMTKPGLTGPWQIFFRSTSDYESRVEMLEEYYAKASPIYDLRMVILTGLTPFDTKKAA